VAASGPADYNPADRHMADSSALSRSWESGGSSETIRLLALARSGDDEALERLLGRYLGPLRRWAAGRLPRWARDIADTQDLVQDTLLHTFRNIDGFEARHEGALYAYLRQALLNRIRNELRRAGRHAPNGVLDSQAEAQGPSPLEAAIGREQSDRYERALANLRREDREILIARVELGCSYEEIAATFGRPSIAAARKAAQRALLRLAAEMKRERHASNRR
jgi:RNA polymerase sigma-70 factor (ECF subfamily)